MANLIVYGVNSELSTTDTNENRIKQLNGKYYNLLDKNVRGLVVFLFLIEKQIKYVLKKQFGRGDKFQRPTVRYCLRIKQTLKRQTALRPQAAG